MNIDTNQNNAFKKIIRAVSQNHAISQKAILSDTRLAPVVLARQEAMYLCQLLMGESYPAIARRFGCKSHGTVVAAVKRVAKNGDLITLARQAGAILTTPKKKRKLTIKKRYANLAVTLEQLHIRKGGQ